MAAPFSIYHFAINSPINIIHDAHLLSIATAPMQCPLHVFHASSNPKIIKYACAVFSLVLFLLPQSKDGKYILLPTQS